MFKVHQVLTGEDLPLVYVPCGTGTFKVGQAMIIDSGVLDVAEDAETPEYICMKDVTVASSGELVPCYKVHDNIIWEVPAAVSISGVAIGTKLQISKASGKEGLYVTATGSGHCELIAKRADGSQYGTALVRIN